MSIENILVPNNYNIFANSIVLKQGNLSLIGATGLQGPTGIQGLEGNTGLSGNTGPQGIQGFMGNTGLQGPMGNPGATGLMGTTGLISSGDVPDFFNSAGILQDSGISASNLPLLNASNTFTGSNNSFNSINCTTFAGNGGVPTVALASGAGSGASSGIQGNSLTGLLSIVTGTGASGGTLATMTMPASLSHRRMVMQ
jgi:hypothetical protein